MEKILGFISDILLIIGTLITMIFSLIAVKNYSMDQNLMREYLDNWNNGPIMDIVATSSASCPAGYSSLFSGGYAGSVNGCNCVASDRDKYKGQIFNRTCTRNMIIYGCSMVFPTPSQNFTTWRGKKLCAMREVSNFWKLEFASYNGACPSFKKPCGALDSFGNVLCVNNDEACAVNSIEIQPNNKPSTLPNPNKIKLNDNYNLYFASVQNSSLPILVNLYPGKQVCAHPFEGKLTENDYPLNNMRGPNSCVTQINGFLTDARFSSFDSNMLINFYNENNITSLIAKLPYYPQPSANEVVSLWRSNYFGWNRNCFNDPAFSFNQANPYPMSDPAQVNTYFSRAYTMAVFAVLSFAYCFCLIFIYKMIVVSFSISHQAILCIDIMNFMFITVIFAYSVNLIGNTNRIVDPYRHFIDKACGDQITNGVISLAFGDIVKSVSNLKAVMIITLIEMVFLVVYYVYYVYKMWGMMHLKRH